MKVQVGIFECTGIKGQDLVHSYYKVLLYFVVLKVNENSCRLRMGTYRDGVKRNGDKIGMGI